MTQAPPDRLDRLESVIERLDHKLDAIATDVVEIKVSQARTDERLSALDTQLEDIKLQLRSQDTRLWGFIVTLSLAVIGFLSKLAFFPAT
jgi:septal ring factor EnvC (AmiA/AmiB activator)